MENFVRSQSPVAELRVEVDDEPLLVVGEEAPLEVGPQVVGPPEPAALPAPQQPCPELTSRTHGQRDATQRMHQAEAGDPFYLRAWGRRASSSGRG
jgi:hypothetical protein